jgi:hypothetical protein
MQDLRNLGNDNLVSTFAISDFSLDPLYHENQRELLWQAQQNYV